MLLPTLLLLLPPPPLGSGVLASGAGSVGSVTAPSWCPRPSRPPPKLPLGVLSAVAHFGADPSGQTDATVALQRGITAARTDNVTLFLPLGCYRVTDQLNATVPRNGRWQPVVIVGQRVPPGARRPTLFLPSNSPNFNSGPYKGGINTGRALLTYRANWCLAPGSKPDALAGGCLYGTCCTKGVFRSTGGYNFNQILESVDIVIGAGNPNAVGVNMGGAQGAAINEVTVHAAPDALACVSGGNVGGSFARLRVSGARFGLDMRNAQAPNLVGVSVVNSTCAGIVYGGGPSLTATGLRIEGSPLVAGVIAGIGGRDGWSFPETLTVPLECRDIPGPPHAPAADDFYSEPITITVENSASSGLVDTIIALRPASTTRQAHKMRTSGSDGDRTLSVPCVLSNSSLYLNNVWFSGCQDLVQSANRMPLRANMVSANSTVEWISRTHQCEFSHVKLLGWGRIVPPNAERWNHGGDPKYLPAHSYQFPAIVDGVRHAEGLTQMTPETSHGGLCKNPPNDLQSKHLWSEENHRSGTTWQTPHGVNAIEDCAAKGDGLTDDWAALQQCIAQHEVVVLPKGLFRLSQPLVLHRGALVGVGRTLSFLAPTTDAPTSLNGTAAWPLLDVVVGGNRGDNDVGVHVGWLTLAVWDHLPHVYAMRWGGHNSSSSSATHPDSTWRQAFQNRLKEATFPPLLALLTSTGSGVEPPIHKPGGYFNRPLVEVRAAIAAYDFNLDFGCCFGTYFPPAWMNSTPGADIASSAEILLQGPEYRTLLIVGAKNVRFYAHNTEQDFGNAHTEIRDSFNVSLFGTKSEGNNVDVWIRDSTLVSIHGYGGNGAAFANDTNFSDPKIWGHPGGSSAPAYIPSLFRVTNSSRVLLANLVDNPRFPAPVTLMSAGFGVDPAHWNMVLRDDSAIAAVGSCVPYRHQNLSRPTTADICSTTAVYDRPVLWQWSGTR